MLSKAQARREAARLAREAWCVEQEGFDPAREHEMESIFTVGNGYLGVRGTFDTPLPGSRADLFVAGIYDRKQSSLPYSELEFLTEDRGSYPYSELVPLPFPCAVRTAVDGRPLDLVQGPWRGPARCAAPRSTAASPASTCAGATSRRNCCPWWCGSAYPWWSSVGTDGS